MRVGAEDYIATTMSTIMRREDVEMMRCLPKKEVTNNIREIRYTSPF